MSTHPTTFADLEAAGWTPGAGASGHRFRYTTVGAYEVGAYNDGWGIYMERSDDEHHIDTADACILASKIAALLRGEIATNLAAALDERDVAHADFEASANDYEIVAAERDTARAEAETLRARLYVETEARRRAFSALASALSVDADNNDTNRLIEAANAAASHIKAGTETVNRLDLTVSKLEVDLAKAEARLTEIYADLQQQIKAAHAMFDEADVEGCLGVLADRVKALAIDRGRVTNALEAVTKERDAARADLAKARANNDLLDQVMVETATALGVKPDNEAILEAIHLLQEQHANNPAPADPHDPPTETAAEATVRRLRS